MGAFEVWLEPSSANSGTSARLGIFLIASGGFGVIFLFGLILNSAYGTKGKAIALRKSAMVDLESNQLLSAKIKFQELGEHNIVQEIIATLNKQSLPHDKSIQNQVQNITITNITDSAMSGDINVMGTKKDNN